MGGSAGKALDEAAEAYDAEVDLARQAFAPFIPRFDGSDARREAWLSDRQKRDAGAKAIRMMFQQEQTAVRAIERACP